MHVLIAPDGFDDALTSEQAAEALAQGWRGQVPDDVVVTCPLGDGGPGFLSALHAALGSELATTTVTGPQGGRVPANVLLFAGTAYVEASQACGPDLVPVGRRDPWNASSVGVGELIRVALETGADRVVVGLGPAVSHDGGAGMLAGLGAGVPDDDAVLRGGGSAVGGVRAEDLPGLDGLRERLAGVEIVGACDVDVPLLGLNGASALHARGKGATEAQAQQLEWNLGAFAQAAVTALGDRNVRPDLLSRPGSENGVRPEAQRFTGVLGAGAAGGLGFALTLLGARLLPGAGVVADAVGLPELVAAADLVVTGEGVFDWSSLHGSVVATVARHGLDVGVPTVVVAGEVLVGRREWGAAGVAGVYPVVDRPDPSAPLADAAAALRSRARRLARTWSH